MNAKDTERFQRVTPATELLDIRPMEMRAAVLRQPPAYDAPVQLALETSLRLERQGPEQFSVAARFGLKTMAEGETEPFAQFSYSVAASYSLSGGAEFADEDLHPFAQHNSMLHLWPYFRSFVQASCGQMMIPPVVVPVFRVTGSSATGWTRVESGGAPE